jgi:hypothetical protein
MHARCIKYTPAISSVTFLPVSSGTHIGCTNSFLFLFFQRRYGVDASAAAELGAAAAAEPVGDGFGASAVVPPEQVF